jgi:hypothetical protein
VKVKLIKMTSLVFLVLLSGLPVFLTGCGGRAQALEETTGIPLIKAAARDKPGYSAGSDDLPEDVAAVPDEPPEGMTASLLTGLWICEEAAARRPFAVVFGNDNNALPQIGLMQADIIYEVLAEGAITRVVGVFQDFDGTKIGPVRSSRQYLMEIANEFGAVFVHHGSSPQGYAALRSYRTGSIDGMTYDGTVFWRDAARRAARGMEHSSFTSAANLLNNVNQRNINMDAPADLGLFRFYESLSRPSFGLTASLVPAVTVRAHETHATAFRYNPENGLYYKDAYGNPHMDEYTNEQVAVSNVIVQLTSVAVIAGDPEGRRNVVLTGSGEGLLFSGGGYSRIRWERDNVNSPTRWFDDSGESLTVNKGRTWITITDLQPIAEVAGSGG